MRLDLAFLRRRLSCNYPAWLSSVFASPLLQCPRALQLSLAWLISKKNADAFRNPEHNAGLFFWQGGKEGRNWV